jgi:sec-independent protein translocase protein TatB
MFDIGFSELLVIAVVALVVLGPERLPKAARFAGLWVRKARAQWYSVKSEFEREMAADELRRSLAEPAAQLRDELARTGREVRDGVAGVDRELRDGAAAIGRDVRTPAVAADADADSAVWPTPAAQAGGPAVAAPGDAGATGSLDAPTSTPTDPAQAPLDFDGVHRTPRRTDPPR